MRQGGREELRRPAILLTAPYRESRNKDNGRRLGLCVAV